MPDHPDIIVVGAGLAGLHTANQLVLAGHRVSVLECSDGPGGRVRSDVQDGFVLDRGFQVLLTAYPTARRVFDYEALDLRAFDPGALVAMRGRLHTLGDPSRKPSTLASTMAAPVGTFGDKLRMLRLRAHLASHRIEELLAEDETTTEHALMARWKFSGGMIERFFRPFIGGVTFDPELGTSSRFFHFVMKMFAEGDAVVPAKGMQALTDQLASRLPAGALETGVEVRGVDASGVTLADGSRRQARAVVAASGGFGALDQELGTGVQSVSVTTLYFSADRPPVADRLLILDGERSGPVNNVAVLSNLSEDYAPAGKALISASVVRAREPDERLLAERARAQMTHWFGREVSTWKLIRTYRIEHALPEQSPPSVGGTPRPAKLESGVFVAGDHREHASIEGALLSAQRCAGAVLADLG